MAARVFSVEFRSAIAQRILNGEKTLGLSRELKIKRSVLYRWRDAYREAGKDGFQKKPGRPPGMGAKLVPKDGKPGTDGTFPGNFGSMGRFARVVAVGIAHHLMEDNLHQATLHSTGTSRLSPVFPPGFPRFSKLLMEPVG